MGSWENVTAPDRREINGAVERATDTEQEQEQDDRRDDGVDSPADSVHSARLSVAARALADCLEDPTVDARALRLGSARDLLMELGAQTDVQPP